MIIIIISTLGVDNTLTVSSGIVRAKPCFRHLSGYYNTKNDAWVCLD